MNSTVYFYTSQTLMMATRSDVCLFHVTHYVRARLQAFCATARHFVTLDRENHAIGNFMSRSRAQASTLDSKSTDELGLQRALSSFMPPDELSQSTLSFAF